MRMRIRGQYSQNTIRSSELGYYSTSYFCRILANMSVFGEYWRIVFGFANTGEYCRIPTIFGGIFYRILANFIEYWRILANSFWFCEYWRILKILFTRTDKIRQYSPVFAKNRSYLPPKIRQKPILFFLYSNEI